MSDTPTEICLPKLWLQAEAAALLRRSCGHVTRLRLERKLGYFRRRPVTISQDDLEIFVARAKQRRVLRKESLKLGGKNERRENPKRSNTDPLAQHQGHSPSWRSLKPQSNSSAPRVKSGISACGAVFRMLLDGPR